MIWKVGGKIRRLPASVETPDLESCKTLHFMALFSSSSNISNCKHDAIEEYLIWSCAM